MDDDDDAYAYITFPFVVSSTLQIVFDVDSLTFATFSVAISWTLQRDT